MLRLMYTCAAALLFAVASLPAQTTAASTPSDRPAHAARRRPLKAAPKVQEPPPQPTAIAPMTPEQLPAAAPRVSYRNGVLSVDSDNSTLGSVLNAIRRQTGAQIDVPPAGAGQRVAAHLSGSPRAVISSLLDGSDLGYAIISSPDNPDRVQQVILMVQSRGGGQPSGFAANPAPAQGPPPPVENNPDLAPADDGPTAEQMNERFPQGQEPPPGQQEVQPNPNGGEQPPNGMPDRPPQMPPAQPPQSQDSGQPQARTPEQLLQELQRMRNSRNSNQ